MIVMKRIKMIHKNMRFQKYCISRNVAKRAPYLGIFCFFLNGAGRMGRGRSLQWTGMTDRIELSVSFSWDGSDENLGLLMK